MPARREIDQWFYVPQWTPTVRAAKLRPSPFSPQPKQWLILSDSLGIGTEVAARLRSAGDRVVTVAAGESFTGTAEEGYCVRPDSAAGFEALFAGLRAAGMRPETILHLWTLSGTQPYSLEQVEKLGFYSLLALTQALDGNPVELGIVSNYVQSLDDAEIVHPEKALILGPSTVIPQEFSNIVCRAVDVEADADTVRIASQIIARI